MTGNANPSRSKTKATEVWMLEILTVAAEAGRPMASELLEHCGIDLAVMGTPNDVPTAWLNHYRTSTDRYDTKRLEHDVRTWPAIASLLAQSMHRDRVEKSHA